MKSVSRHLPRESAMQGRRLLYSACRRPERLDGPSHRRRRSITRARRGKKRAFQKVAETLAAPPAPKLSFVQADVTTLQLYNSGEKTHQPSLAVVPSDDHSVLDGRACPFLTPAPSFFATEDWFHPGEGRGLATSGTRARAG